MSEEKKLKILFIMPLPISWEKAVRWEPSIGGWRMNIHFIEPGLPNGPLSIAAYVQKTMPDVEIRIFDASAFLLSMKDDFFIWPVEYEDFVRLSLNYVKKFQPDIIAFSSMFNGTYSGLGEYTASAAEKFPGAMIVLGGHLAAALPERIIRDIPAVDAVCFGEGEIPFLGLCQAFVDAKDEKKTFPPAKDEKNGKISIPHKLPELVRHYLQESPSWITRKKLALGFKPKHEFIENLDEIPPVDLSLLYFKDDFLNAKGFASYVFRKEPFKGKEIMLFPTRGCPNRCIFCASQNVHGHKVRRQSPERIKEDISYYNSKYGVTHFIFFDDSFLYDKSAAIDALDFIGDHGWDASVPTPAFFAIDDEVATAFAHAGVQGVEVNVESGNKHTLKEIVHKPASLERAEQTAKYLRRHGVLSIGSVLLGFPGETVSSIIKGLSYLKTMDMDMFMVWVATPLPGSEMWDICLEKGYFGGELMPHYSDPAIETPGFTKTQIKYLYHTASKMLNFDNNRYFRSGEWEKAYEFFQNPLFAKSFISEYYLALCAVNMGKYDIAEKHKKKYMERMIQETEGDRIYRRWVEKELKIEKLAISNE